MSKPLRALADVHYGKSPNEVLSDEGSVPVIGTGGVYGRASRALFNGPAVIVPRKGSLANPQFVDTPFWPVDTTFAVIASNGVNAKWLYYQLASFDLTRLNEATGVPSISRDWLYKILLTWSEYEAQQKIAEILSTVDEAIEQTEVLIAKHQQVKAGLMHDLFTRGVTHDGRLRPPRSEAPQLYKQSALGWIPKDWDVTPVALFAESLIDGPFGSNLKSEHYVEEAGVRVVRLQNIQDGIYNDLDRAYISENHANYLARHTVHPGDILIAALGEDRYPVGRSCCYPAHLAPAINKADCFRLRCQPNRAKNAYVMNFLNTHLARMQVARYEQGVTRRRINLGNLRRLFVSLPSLDEQEMISRYIVSSDDQIEFDIATARKLAQEKAGLMQDLLTGRVRVKNLKPKLA